MDKPNRAERFYIESFVSSAKMSFDQENTRPLRGNDFWSKSKAQAKRHTAMGNAENRHEAGGNPSR